MPPVSLMFLPSALPKGARVLLVTGEFCATSCFSSTVDAWVGREVGSVSKEDGRNVADSVDGWEQGANPGKWRCFFPANVGGGEIGQKKYHL